MPMRSPAQRCFPPGASAPADGSVDLAVPTDLNANIDASTNDGRISVGIPVMVEGNFSNSQIKGKMNGGGQPVTIHTGDGSIRLNRS